MTGRNWKYSVKTRFFNLTQIGNCRGSSMGGSVNGYREINRDMM